MRCVRLQSPEIRSHPKPTDGCPSLILRDSTAGEDLQIAAGDPHRHRHRGAVTRTTMGRRCPWDWPPLSVKIAFVTPA
jgi:hypothetical protein